MEAEKETYSKEDLQDMKKLVDFFKTLPDTGKMEEVMEKVKDRFGWVHSSSELKFICECGTKNSEDRVYCVHCGKNIKGLYREQQQIIDGFIGKVEILQSLLEEK